MFGMDQMGGSPPQNMPADDGPVPVDEVVGLLRQALEQDGEFDADDRLLFEQVTTLIAKFQANRAKQQEAALGGGPATKYLRRSSGA